MTMEEIEQCKHSVTKNNFMSTSAQCRRPVRFGCGMKAVTHGPMYQVPMYNLSDQTPL